MSRYRTILESWIGTPYRHYCAVKTRGADCVLFIAKTLEEMGLLPETVRTVQYYPKTWHIHGNQEIMLDSLESYKNKLSVGQVERFQAPEPQEYLFGDWLVYAVSPKKLSNHSAIYMGDGKIIHAIQKKTVDITEIGRLQERYTYCYRLYI